MEYFFRKFEYDRSSDLLKKDSSEDIFVNFTKIFITAFLQNTPVLVLRLRLTTKMKD